MRKLNLVGRVFGRITVISEAPIRVFKSGSRKSAWNCKCQCGTEFQTVGNYLTSGAKTSCGCAQRESISRTFTTHGHATGVRPSPTYHVWKAMVSRCSNPNIKSFKDYGGRGITVCERWEKFSNFLADMGERPEGLEIDRIDNSKGYEPHNCHWVTRAENSRNKRTNVRVSFDGMTMTIAEWARKLGVSKQTLYTRYRAGKRGIYLIYGRSA